MKPKSQGHVAAKAGIALSPKSLVEEPSDFPPVEPTTQSVPPSTQEVAKDAGPAAPPVKADTRNYKVGYGCPPLETRWKKGQSGNPKGKAKGTKSLKTVISQWASGKLTVKKNGHQKTMTNLEAQIERLNIKGLSGDIRAAALLLQFAKQYVPEDFGADAADKLAPEDLAILRSHAKLIELVERVTGDDRDEPDDGGDNSDE